MILVFSFIIPFSFAISTVLPINKSNISTSLSLCLLNFVNKDAQLAAFKNKLANYRGDIRYTKPYYTYTNITPNTMTAVEYKRNIDEVYSIFTNALSGDFMSNLSSDEYSDLGNINSTKINMIRGHLLGLSDGVSYDNYHDALFRYFRNGEMNRSTDKVKMFENDFIINVNNRSIPKNERTKILMNGLLF